LIFLSCHRLQAPFAFPKSLFQNRFITTQFKNQSQNSTEEHAHQHSDPPKIAIAIRNYLGKLYLHFLNMARKKGPVIGPEENPKPEEIAPGVDSSLETPSGSFSTNSANPTCPHCDSLFQDKSITVCLTLNEA
jgi:hypothetical protein